MRILALCHKDDLDQELARIGADEAAWDIFQAKREVMAIKVRGLSTAGANILKQTALAGGGDCAVHHSVASGRVRRSDAILFATKRQLSGLSRRLEGQPECVSRLVPEFAVLDERFNNPDLAIRIGRRRIDLGGRTYVMGILNITPDSFYDGGRYSDPKAALDRALEIEAEQADFIDIGAESTRPGSVPVSPSEQLRRLLPVLKLVRSKLKIVISVDTSRARVAEAALDAGARMVNDTSGFPFAPGMAKVIARAGVPCVVMHIRGKPRTMQRKPEYKDLMGEITDWLEAAIERGVRAGVKREQMIVDPGIGFGKRVEHNCEILRRLAELRSLGRPVLVGPSRKSFIGKTLGLEPEQRLEGTLGACVLAAQNGGNIVRVHDVKQVVRALRMADAINGRRTGKPGPTGG